MNLYVRTCEQLLDQGNSAEDIASLCRRRALTELLPGVYCSRRRPTTLDRCHAVVLAAPGAVLSHRTAAWLHGLLPEPHLIEAYVPDAPPWPLPSWLRLYLADFVDGVPGPERAVLEAAGVTTR